MQFWKAMNDKDICWTGKVVKNCQDCLENIEKYNIVPVKTADQYLREVNK